MSLRSIDMLMREMQTLGNQGRYQEALQKGQTLLAMLPTNEIDKRAYVSYNMGTIYNNLGQYSEAETYYAAAVPGDADDSDLWYNRALNQTRWADASRRPEEKRAHFQQALEYGLEAQRLNPTDSDIRKLLALLRQMFHEL